MTSEERDSTWPAKITPNVGTAVTGDRRFPRPELEAEFDTAMTGGNGATLFGLRRIGKSSEADECANRLVAAKHLVIQIDAEGMVSEADLLSAMLNAMPAKTWTDRAMQLITGDNAIAGAVRTAVRQLTKPDAAQVQAYFGPIAAAVERAIQPSDKLVLIIDEFPWLCRNVLQADPHDGRRRIEVLLASLRKWRVAGMRMLLMGSIGMVGLSREYRLDANHLNDLTAVAVPPLDRAEAEAFIPALVLGGNVKGWTENHTQALLDESAALYPSMLQFAFQKLTTGNKAAELNRISDIFADKIRPDLDSAYYQQFDQRVQRYKALPEPMPQLLRKFLETVLSSEAAVSRTSLYEPVGNDTNDADLGDSLNMLREDGFLAVRITRDHDQQWRAASDLVIAWWNQRRGGKHR